MPEQYCSMLSNFNGVYLTKQLNDTICVNAYGRIICALSCAESLLHTKSVLPLEDEGAGASVCR